MRVVGVLLFLLGGAGTAFFTWATYRRGRPQDVVFGALAPLALLIALLGLLLAFVPDFLD
ncbi:MAG: hypothetical protein AAGC55_23530 [Myxococcota bacterium]